MKIVFTDLDGTLLDHDTYSFQAAEEAISYLKEHDIPVVFCTSKTREEIVYWKKEIGNNHPFISENGGGVFIPVDYFSFSFQYTKKVDEFYLIRLGERFAKLQKVMNALENEYDITSFLQYDVTDLMKEAGLSKLQAKKALNRDFDIPFVLHDKHQENDIIKDIKQMKLNVVKGGRFYHLMGENDKGKAVKLLTRLFSKKYDQLDSIGIGDSENDFPMLNQVDKAYLVKRKDNSFASSSYKKSDGIGPVGWQRIIEKEFYLHE